MHDRDRRPRRLRREIVTEDLAEQIVHHGMKSLFGEASAILLRLPDVDVPKPALRALDRNVRDEALWHFVAETVGDALVERPRRWARPV